MCVSMFKCNEVFKKKAIDYASSSSKSVCVNINIMSLDNTGTVPKTTEQLASPPHPLPHSLTCCIPEAKVDRLSIYHYISRIIVKTSQNRVMVGGGVIRGRDKGREREGERERDVIIYMNQDDYSFVSN